MGLEGNIEFCEVELTEVEGIFVHQYMVVVVSIDDDSRKSKCVLCSILKKRSDLPPLVKRVLVPPACPLSVCNQISKLLLSKRSFETISKIKKSFYDFPFCEQVLESLSCKQIFYNIMKSWFQLFVEFFKE